MAFDLQLFGAKLKRYRGQLDMGIPELSQGSGIPEKRLFDLESGKLFPTGDEILILSDIFKCDYRFFVSNEMYAIFEKTETLFRKHGDSFSKDDRYSILEFLFLCDCEQELIENLGKQEQFIDFKFKKIDSYYKGHGVEAAQKLRSKLGLAKNEVRLDVFKLFRKLGIHIFRRKLGNSNISGLFIKHPEVGKCVLVNYDEDIYRQRFTISHEVGHALLDDDQDFIVSFKKWNKSDLVEVRANTFASNFLIPRDYIIKVHDIVKIWTREQVFDWTNKLKVNTETLANSLSDADLISKDMVRKIKSYKLPKNLKNDPELWETDTERQIQKRKYLIERGLSSFYVDLCFEAYRQGIISAGRLAEILLCDEDELLELVNIFGGKICYD